MAISFDGLNKLIILSSGTTNVSAGEIYSRWKDWVRQGTNSKYLPAFQNSVGGDNLGSGTYLGSYYFIQNGWRIKPQEANHTLNINGNIFPVPDSFDMFAPTTGNYNVKIQLSRSSLTQAVEVGGSGGSSPSVNDIVQGLLSAVIEGDLTLKDSLKIANAVHVGLTSGMNTLTPVIRNPENTKDRITAITDGQGNRSNVVLDLGD